MAAYSQVYDSRHLQADCQVPGSAPEPISAIEYGLPLPFTTQNLYRGFKYLQINYTFSYSYDPNSTSSAAKLFNSHSETYLPVNRITSFLFNNCLFTGTNIVEWYVKMGQIHLIT